jgi:rubrerythrin
MKNKEDKNYFIFKIICEKGVIIMVKIFRCRICGDSYIGKEAPTRCPFCGALTKYFVEAQDWDKNEFNVPLSDVIRSDLKSALELELDNAAFYDCAKNTAEKAGDDYGYAKFKALMKVEREHASAISKLLKISRPELKKRECSTNTYNNTKDGWEREKRAIKAYETFRDKAVGPRLKEFFGALVEIETDHLDLHAENLKTTEK